MQFAIKCFIISVPSQKKLNTYSVESPCNHLPEVGSFLANPGLSKEQLVPSCVVRTFVMVDIFIELLALHPINPLNETMFSQKKLNTDGVESPCECLPGVGSFLANPGLSKEQLVPSCVVRTFIMVDIFMEILA